MNSLEPEHADFLTRLMGDSFLNFSVATLGMFFFFFIIVHAVYKMLSTGNKRRAGL